MAAANALRKTASKTVTDTVVGEHTHTIVGYSLIKGIGDGEPIASERFVVGGHEWVLLFYPDGKRSSSEGPMGNGPGGEGGGLPAVVLPPGVAGVPGMPPRDRDDPLEPAGVGAGVGVGVGAAEPRGGAAVADAVGHHHPAPAALLAPHHGAPMLAQMGMHRQQRRDTTNEYAALFVALIGEGPNPQGIVNTTEGKVVRAFHRFTLVDQTGGGRDLTKGRTRDAGAVKISCARQDPNARNCHGYRKFVKRSLLEDPSKGYLVGDTLVIRYTIELVVSSGGALMRGGSGSPRAADLIAVPPPSLGADLAALLAAGEAAGADVTLVVDGEEFKAHKFLLEARSGYFRALLGGGMREGREGRAEVGDIRAPVFRALLHFVYTDSLPEGMDDAHLEVEMAQHLLAAADLCQLERLRRLAERRLCEAVDAEACADTLVLADRHHAEELKKVCLDYMCRNLDAVVATKGYSLMVARCPGLLPEVLATVAALSATGEGAGANAARAAAGGGHGMRGGSGGAALGGGGGGTGGGGGGGARLRELVEVAEEVRRVRPRRE